MKTSYSLHKSFSESKARANVTFFSSSVSVSCCSNAAAAHPFGSMSTNTCDPGHFLPEGSSFAEALAASTSDENWSQAGSLRKKPKRSPWLSGGKQDKTESTLGATSLGCVGCVRGFSGTEVSFSRAEPPEPVESVAISKVIKPPNFMHVALDTLSIHRS